MHCLYCGKPLGFLKELTDGEFCCGQHRQRYKKLTKMALARLLDTKAEIARDVSPIERQTDSVSELRSSVSSILFAPRDVKKTRDYSQVLRHFPRPHQIPVRIQPADEAIHAVPGPSLPGFSHSPVRPLLGNAAPIWGRLDPVPPSSRGLALGVILMPSELPSPVPRFDFLSGMLRQGSAPTLREARFSSPLPAPAQPSPSSATPDVAPVRPIFELPFAVAMPTALGPAVRPLLHLAQPIPQTFAISAAITEPAIARPEIAPAPFPVSIAWRKSEALRLAVLDLPPAVELTSATLCERVFPIAPDPQAALESCHPDMRTEWKGWSMAPTLASARSGVELVFSVTRAGFQLDLAPARQIAARPLGEAHAVSVPAAALLPRLTVGLGTHPTESAARSAEAAAAVPEVVPESAAAGFPVAGLLPLAARAVVPASATAAVGVGPAPFRPLMASMPAVGPVPARQVLGSVGSRVEEMRALDAAAAPIRASHGEVAAAGSSVLPALASLFRYSKSGRVQRGAAVSFEGVVPKDQPRVPLAYMELPMPLRAPAVPRTSSLRIVETFEYLRPLDRPALDPFQALLRLWRTTPAYLRFASVSFCVVMMLWAVSPGRVGTLLESRWADVRKSIQDRATIELVDNFEGGSLGGWQGTGNWVRSWTFNEAGYIRPGRLALYIPSEEMQDYRLEFLTLIDRKAVNWVYRAADGLNCYVTKLVVVKPGPAPEMALVRYPVINGVEGERTEVPIRMLMHNNTPYRVQVAVRGSDFSTSIEGQLVDHWRDARLAKGGVGFFSEAGERARIYWVKLSHQDDFVGRLCSYMYPNPIMLRSGNLP